MKRSDLINEIFFRIPHLTIPDIMCVMEVIEEAGMLPPIEAGMCQDHWISAQPEAFECFKWDDE
jgi:hypothetical protein